jgi:hypothetical protein
MAPLTGHLGCLGIGVGLMAAAALGLSRRALITLASVWVAGFAWIALTPAKWSAIAGEGPPTDTTLATGFWQTFGILALLAFICSAILLTMRFRKGLSIRPNADAIFLAGWLLIELGGYFALTPFGAARRVIGLVVVGGLLASRAVSRIDRIHPGQVPHRWITGFTIAVGVVVAAIDTLDAFPEKVCAERAAGITANREADSTVWFAGHWGFQYYCERAGMRQIIPGESVLLPGDMLVLPIHPDEVGFYRPHIGNVSIHPPLWAVSNIDEVVWDDPIAAQTVPNFYGGVVPIIGRNSPRLRVGIYRVTGVWKVPR